MDQQIRNVMATLQTLDIKPTYDNMNKLLGCLQVLDNVWNSLAKENGEPKLKVVKNEPEGEDGTETDPE